MKISEFVPSLRKKLPHNIFIFGSDSHFVEQAKQSLAKALTESLSGDLISTTLDLEDAPVEELINFANCLPMFATRQLIQVKGVMKLREAQAKKLGEYFKSPNPSTYLVFIAGELDRDQRKKKVFETLRQGINIVEITPLDARELSQWICERFVKEGFSVDPDVPRFLIDLQGNDSGRLNQEIEKAILYASSEKAVTLETVQATSGFGCDHTLNEFIDALSAKDKQKALRLLGEILATGKEIGLAVWWLGQQLRWLLQFKELAGKSSPAGIAKQIGAYRANTNYNEFANRLMSQAKQFQTKTLIQAIDRLATVDDRIKKSSLDTNLLMEMLVYDLTK